ncbi:MAG TPA: phosphoribosyl-AMP cyclohydrolase [Rhodothermales bacterium]|nr:phosphoribosyl-AMP cyclohydrolase [Rhodothermales bacterium]
MNANVLLEQAKFGSDGLVTAIAQDHRTNEILMVAYMNAETLRQTLETGVMTYWSRSRRKVWVKGESSGNTQEVQEVRIDCDGDALLFKVEQKGAAACHTGHRSCFYRKLEGDALVETDPPLFDPAKVYGH